MPCRELERYIPLSTRYSRLADYTLTCVPLTTLSAAMRRAWTGREYKAIRRNLEAIVYTQ